MAGSLSGTPRSLDAHLMESPLPLLGGFSKQEPEAQGWE